MTKHQEKLTNWINFPRNVLSLYRNKQISRNEYFTYMHLRLNCTPYGISTTSIGDIGADVFGDRVTDSYVNKILLALKSKRLLWYEKRQGVRGSFEVRLGDFILPDGNIQRLNQYFQPQEVRSRGDTSSSNRSEVTPELNNISQRLKEQKIALNLKLSMSPESSLVRSRNTDNDNEKDNDITDMSGLKISKPIGELLTEHFTPQNYEEDRIWTIAKEVGEKDMRFLKSILKNHGLRIIEKARGELKEGANKGIKNQGAYLNSIIKRLIGENNIK